MRRHRQSRRPPQSGHRRKYPRTRRRALRSHRVRARSHHQSAFLPLSSSALPRHPRNRSRPPRPQRHRPRRSRRNADNGRSPSHRQRHLQRHQPTPKQSPPNTQRPTEGLARNLECGGLVYPEPRRAAAFTAETCHSLCVSKRLQPAVTSSIDTRNHPAYRSARMKNKVLLAAAIVALLVIGFLFSGAEFILSVSVIGIALRWLIIALIAAIAAK